MKKEKIQSELEGQYRVMTDKMSYDLLMALLEMNRCPLEYTTETGRTFYVSAAFESEAEALSMFVKLKGLGFSHWVEYPLIRKSA